LTIQPYQAIPAGLAQPNGQPAATRQMQGLSSLFFGIYKVGKSSLGDTGPEPVLALDSETAASWTPSTKIYWNPLREQVPSWPCDPRAASPRNPEGRWHTCVVVVQDYNLLHTTHKILNTGQHPFNSVTIDSVPTIQQRVMMSLAGYKKMERDHWGMVLRQVMGLIWSYRDLLTHPYRPVWAVTFIAGAHWDDRMRKWRPILSGQAADLTPYVPDLTGWLEAAPDGRRHLWIGPSPIHETGNRLWGRLPDDMVVGYPGRVEGWTIESMVAQVIQS